MGVQRSICRLMRGQGGQPLPANPKTVTAWIIALLMAMTGTVMLARSGRVISTRRMS